MSGIEIIGAIASATAIVEVSLKLLRGLSRLTRGAAEVHLAANDLHSKISQLYQTTHVVSFTLKFREKEVGSNPQGQGEIEILKKIKSALDICEKTLREFEGMLEGLLTENENPGWLRKALKQLRKDIKKSIIARTEATIDTQLHMLQVCLACYHINMAAKNHDETNSRLENLLKVITNDNSYLEFLHRQNVSFPEDESLIQSKPHDVDDNSASELNGDTGEKISIKKCFNAASTFMSAYDLGTSENHSPKSRPQSGHESSDNEPVKDPTPEFDDTTPWEVLIPLIKAFKLQVEEDKSNRHFEQAETNQILLIELLKEKHIVFDSPFEDYYEMQRSLAEIYLENEKVDEAKEVLHDLLQGRIDFKANPNSVNIKHINSRQGSDYLLLSKANYVEYRKGNQEKFLEAAQRDAKRAFKSRLDDVGIHDPLFLKGVKWLVEIYKEQDKMVHANTYHDLYLQQDPSSGESDSSISRRPSASSSPSSNISISSVSTDAPFLIAAEEDNMTVMIELLSKGVNLNHRGKQDWTALHFAAHNDNKDMMQLLLGQADIDVNAVCSAGKTTLHYTAESNQTSLAEILLEHKADPEIEDKAQRTCLHIAIKCEKYDFVKMLLDRGVPSEKYINLKTSKEIRTILRNKNVGSNPSGHR